MLNLICNLALLSIIGAWRIDINYNRGNLIGAELRSRCYNYNGKIKAQSNRGQKVCSQDGVFCISHEGKLPTYSGGESQQVTVWYANTVDYCKCSISKIDLQPLFCFPNQSHPLSTTYSCGCDTPKFCQ